MVIQGYDKFHPELSLASHAKTVELKTNESSYGIRMSSG